MLDEHRHVSSLLGVHRWIGSVVVGVASPGIPYESDQNDSRDQGPRDPKECLHYEGLPVSRIAAQVGRAPKGEGTRHALFGKHIGVWGVDDSGPKIVSTMTARSPRRSGECGGHPPALEGFGHARIHEVEADDRR
jgi:hypothetical protein